MAIFLRRHDLIDAIQHENQSFAPHKGRSGFSALKDLAVRGIAMTDVAPNTRVELPADQFGSGSYVMLYEQAGATSRPAPGQTSEGTYAADLEVTMIRVHISDKLPQVPGSQTLDVAVSNAKAHADFPQITVCPGAPLQAVSGHAYILSEANSAVAAPVTHGFVSIPPTGGQSQQDLAQASVSAGRVGAAQSESSGVLGLPTTTASSYAEAASVCVASGPSGCGVSAQVVRSQANSSGTSTTATSNDSGTSFVGLSVLGTPAAVGANRNQVVELPGIGFVILNEQFCDNGAALPTCTSGSAAGTSGLTVRAIHLVVTVPSNPTGLTPGSEIIVAEAHSDVMVR
jgi:hypothetical protein